MQTQQTPPEHQPAHRVFLFTHIPKTAGTSLRYHFQKHLVDQHSFIHLANKGDKQARQQGLLPFAERPLAQRLAARVILGHNVNHQTKQLIGHNTPHELVLLRDPVAWEISRYNQYANAKALRGQPYLPYDDWFDSEPVHCQFDWLLRHYALQADIPTDPKAKEQQTVALLNQFTQVGFVNKLLVHLQPILDTLGISSDIKSENVTGENRKSDLFREDGANENRLMNRLDEKIELFAKIKNIFDR